MLLKILGSLFGSVAVGGVVFATVSLSSSNTKSELKKQELKEQKEDEEVRQSERLVQATRSVLGGRHRCEDSGDSQICYPIEESGQHS